MVGAHIEQGNAQTATTLSLLYYTIGSGLYKVTLGKERTIYSHSGLLATFGPLNEGFWQIFVISHINIFELQSMLVLNVL